MMFNEILDKEFKRQRDDAFNFNNQLMIASNFNAIREEFDCLHFVLNELFPKKHKRALDKWNKERGANE